MLTKAAEVWGVCIAGLGHPGPPRLLLVIGGQDDTSEYSNK